jgi:ABC-type multidrug transport system fused ATPase/permease subunit
LTTFLSIISGFIAVSTTTKGFFVPFATPAVLIYYFAQKYYTATSTELARLDSISKSPIYATFTETLNGLSSIRAFGMQEKLALHNSQLVDKNAKIDWQSTVCQNWLTLRLDICGALMAFTVIMISILTPTGFISASWLALGLTYVFQMTNQLKQGVQMFANAEARMNAVERIQFYSETLEPEAHFLQNEVIPPKEWPQKGDISIENLVVEYISGRPVLKNISLQIGEKCKLGVAGRTGSGILLYITELFI